LIPDFQTLMRPTLAKLADHEVHANKDLIAELADNFGLTDDERRELLPSGSRQWNGRLNWALAYLAQAGLATRPRRGHAQITQRGSTALAEFPSRIDMRTLEAYADYRDFKSRTRERAKDTDVEVEATDLQRAELLEAAVAQNQSVVEGELLEQALALDPTQFERLVLKLLGALGYGQSGRLQHTGRVGDRGIDGIVTQDRLGFDKIYVQAKRYTDNRVERDTKAASTRSAPDKRTGDRTPWASSSARSSRRPARGRSVTGRRWRVPAPSRATASSREH
jgi:restriction system protein